MDAGQSSDAHPNGGEGEEETVEIKIKTLDAQSYTLRVHKNTPVPALKDQIAIVIGVPVENQRLICRGKVLKDDQVLAAYNVEDGHTLHLVARQPPQPPLPSSLRGQDPLLGPSGPSDMVVVSPRNRPGHVSHSLLMGTINIPDSEGGMPDLNRIISAVLSSVGLGNAIPGPTGPGTGGLLGGGPSRSQQAGGPDGQPRLDGADIRLQGGPPTGEQNDSIDDIEAQLQLDAIYGVPSPGIFAGLGANIAPNPFRVVQQPMVVPDALTTMSQYLDRLEQSFSIIEGVSGQSGVPFASESAVQAPGSTALDQTAQSVSGQGASNVAPSSSSAPRSSLNPVTNNDRQGAGVSMGPPASSRRLPTPSALGTIVNRVQGLLSGQAGTALSRLAAQLENETNLVDAVAREDMQRTALRDGNMMQQLGALLLELGRTTLTLRLGQTPAESVVNAGPAVFISPSGPNPMMVQSLPLQTGVVVGALPSGTPQANGGIVGPNLGPRSINIHIHTSDLRLPTPTPSPQQPPRTVIGVSSGAPALTVRQRMEGADAANPEHTLTVRQIIERAEASSGGPPGPGELHPPAIGGGTVHGAIMTFNENGSMRVVPVRTRTAAVPLTGHAAVVNDGDSVFQPLLARFQQQLGSAEHGRPSVSVSGGSAAPVNSSDGTTGTGEQPPPAAPSPAVRAQVHIQAWRPSIMHTLAGGPSEAVPGASPVNETYMQARTQDSLMSANGNENRDPTELPQNRRDVDARVNGQPEEGLISGVDISNIVNTFGPILNQLAVAFQQGRTQQPQQTSVSQPNTESETPNTGVLTAPLGDAPGDRVLYLDGADVPSSSSVENSRPGSDQNVDVKMDVCDGIEGASHFRDGPGSSSSSTLASDEKISEGIHLHEDGSIKEQVGKETRPGTPPVGLGLGGLQPLPARSRRRSHAPLRQVQMGDVGVAATVGNGLPAQRGLDQTLTPAARQSLLQSLVPQMDGASNTPEGVSVEHSLGQLTRGLLPLMGGAGNQGTVQDGDGNLQIGEIMSQLLTRSGGGNSGQGAFPADMLRGMMGQLVQSPIMENLVQQVMTGVQGEGAENAQQSATGSGNRVQGGQAGFDLAGIVQQMLPVVSQMFGSRPTPSANLLVPGSNTLRHHEDSAARDTPGQTNDSGRWRDALSEEEAMSWGQTISADLEQQQLMEPQRPFSDIYVRGSPLAKRQKTDLEGVTQKHENGGLPEDSSRSAPKNVAAQVEGSNASTNGIEVSQLAQHVAGADGVNDAYMAVLFHDLAARVAADPDLDDGSQISSATGVFEQQTPPEESAGG